MIRKDYETGGFLPSDLKPVLCTDSNHQFFIVYTLYDLVMLLKEKAIKTCYGIWPGKKMTDAFVLDPQIYVQLPIPPEQYKDIDNASSITVNISFNGIFSKITYTSRSYGIKIESVDEELFKYVRGIGLKYSPIVGDKGEI